MGGEGGGDGRDREGARGGALTAGSRLVLEHGWQPGREADSPAETRVDAMVRALLPRFKAVLWNVRNDLPAVEMGEILALRMRTQATALDWRETLELEQAVAAARASRSRC